MKNLLRTFKFLSLLVLILGCESTFIPNDGKFTPEYVVEGYIELGPGANPVFVLISKTLPFFAEIGIEELNNAVVDSADVTVRYEDQEVKLTRICLSELDEMTRKAILESLGFENRDTDLEFCIYIDLLDEIEKKRNVSYTLDIELPEASLTSTAMIPDFVPLDSIEFIDPPGNISNPYRQMQAYIIDPPIINNFYRYLTSINNGPFIAGIATVGDDELFDGQDFEFTIQKSEAPGSDFDETFGLFELGDTASIKWMTLEDAHFDFWNTLEFSRANQGPFSTYTRVNGNVTGALGIWGASSVDIYTVIVE